MHIWMSACCIPELNSRRIDMAKEQDSAGEVSYKAYMRPSGRD
jgi:hypothetical protein